MNSLSISVIQVDASYWKCSLAFLNHVRVELDKSSLTSLGLIARMIPYLKADHLHGCLNFEHWLLLLYLIAFNNFAFISFTFQDFVHRLLQDCIDPQDQFMVLQTESLHRALFVVLKLWSQIQ